MTRSPTPPALRLSHLLPLAAVALIASPGRADTFPVTSTADSGPGSLRQAITDAEALPGPDVVDLSGVSGTIALASRLPLISEALEIQGPGMELLTVDGGDSVLPFNMASVGDFVLRDLTVANGRSDPLLGNDGGALRVSGNGAVTLERCRFSSNRAVQDGGAVSVNFSALLTIDDCEFVDNNATGGFSDGGALYANAPLVLTDTLFADNALAGFGRGGALHARGATALVQGCTFSGNTAESRGGGAYMNAPGDGNQLVDCDFLGNHADVAGGLYIHQGSVTGCLFQGNTSDREAAGLWNDLPVPGVTLDDCTFDGNSAGREGGGAVVSGGTLSDCRFLGNATGEESAFTPGFDGGGLAIRNGSVTVERCLFAGNTGDSGGAVGVISGDGPVVLRDCTLRDNLARRRGGAVDCGQPTGSAGLILDLVQCTIVGNQCTGTAEAPSANVPEDGGGGVRQTGEQLVRLTHCTVVGNTAAGPGGGVYALARQPLTGGSEALTGLALPETFVEDESVQLPAQGLVLINSLVAGNTAGGLGHDAFGQLTPGPGRSLLADPRGASGLEPDIITHVDVTLDPQFEALADNGGPLETVLLLAGSLALDAGVEAAALDPTDGSPLAHDARGEGFPRLAGGGVDIGALEANRLSPPTLADFAAVGPTFGAVPLTITFADQSTAGATSWSWDFGDGATSTLQDPVHVYTEPGSYTVTLSVVGPENGDSEVKEAFVLAEPPYTDLGFALPGSFGSPQLVGVGDLLAGTADTIVLNHVPADALCTIYLGSSQIDQAFKGGVLVPAPDDALMVTTSGSGQYVGPLAIPVAAPGTQFFLQAWTEDPGTPQGVSASNALRATIQ